LNPPTVERNVLRWATRQRPGLGGPSRTAGCAVDRL